MAVYDDRERFIPVTKAELIELLSREEGISEENRGKFREFCKMIQAVFHFEFHDQLEDLKKAYSPFDPDRDTVGQLQFTPEEEKEMLVRLVEGFGEACEGANYVRMSDEELNEAFEGWSPFGGINLKLDLNHYVEYALYYRGSTMETRMIRRPLDMIKFDFKKKPFESKVYKRLAILAKVRDQGKASKKFDTDHVFVKLFKNVPALDLEMLFPTTKPALKKMDFFQIWLPVMAGILMMVFQTVGGFFNGVELKSKGALLTETNLESEDVRNSLEGGSLLIYTVDDEGARTLVEGDAAVEVINRLRAAATGSVKEFEQAKAVTEVVVENDFGKAVVYGLLAGGIVGILVLLASWTMKSFFKYLQSKQKYTGVLAQNLFYLNLDNNSGVFNSLIDQAEEEECKEAFFAAFFLNAYEKNPESNEPWTEENLDSFIEHWIEKNLKHTVKDPATGEDKEEGIRVDFEIDDALGKLERYELLKRGDDGSLTMLGWDEALAKVDHVWDNYFQYNES